MNASSLDSGIVAYKKARSALRKHLIDVLRVTDEMQAEGLFVLINDCEKMAILSALSHAGASAEVLYTPQVAS